MVKDFIFWLTSIAEENPIPDEVDCILFIASSQDGYCFLQMNGFEGVPDEHKNCFRPLEAQFFYSKELQNISEKILKYRIKYAIEEAFFDKNLKYEYKNKKIYLMLNKNMEYLFHNN